MYNEVEINRLISLIQQHNGIGNKEELSKIVQNEFGLIKDRKVFSNTDFAIRFSKSERKRMSNTVLSLSALQKYDSRPFFVCIVASSENYLLLANTTFLKKISHSSQELRIDNIKGSFNGSDIIFDFQGIENTPKNFQSLYAYGVVLIETPYFGTNDKGPSLISLMPFSISIQNMRFSILSQYSPNVS